MLTLIKHVAHVVPFTKLMVGDVIATRGTVESPQRLRRIDLIDGFEVLVSTPRNGNDVEAITFTEGSGSVVCGRVEDHIAAKQAREAAKPKTAKAPKATAKNPAPVKTTRVKVDAVAQTTPESAKPTARPTQTRTAPKATTFADKLAAKLTDKLGAKLDTLVETALDAALDAAIERVLA